MADKPFFPGFEGDDEPKKPEPAKPAPAAAPAKPAFDPFAGVKVDTKAGGEAPPPAAKPAAAAKPATGRTTKPATGRTAKPAAPAAAPAPAPASAAAAEDADLKPGSRKDLWKCPHCGAGNKPDRDTCRACGKGRDEPVVIPWWKNNVIRAGILAVIGVVVILVVVITRPDLSLKEPTPANADQQARIGGTGQGSVDLGNGLKLEGEKQIAVCGRVAAVGSGPGGTMLVALALGVAAQEEKPTAKPANGSFEVDGIVLACDAEDGFAPKPGQMLSLTGVLGVLVKEGRVVNEPAGIMPVQVQEFRLGK